MPKTLLNRCQPDSISEFRASAGQRSQDALALAGFGRRTAAIYLWGYAAEMTLKAAYFDLVGYADNQLINIADLKAARLTASTVGVRWPGNLHDVRAWAELLVATRVSIPGFDYRIPEFGTKVVSSATRIHSLWREILRRCCEHLLFI